MAKKAKKKTKSRFAEGAETVSEIGETIGYYMTVCDDLKLIEEYLRDLENITVADLETAVEKYLNVENSNFVDFSKMKIAELRKHAEARGIVDFENKSKPELLEELTR